MQHLSVPLSRPWHSTQIILSVISVALSAAIIAISIVLDGPFVAAWFGASAPAPLVAILWTVAEWVTLCARGPQRGIHPGARAALHLVIGLLSAASAAVQGWRIFGTGARGGRNPGGNLPRILWSLIIVLLAVHSILFARAFVETNRRRQQQQQQQQQQVGDAHGSPRLVADTVRSPTPGAAEKEDLETLCQSPSVGSCVTEK